MNFSELFTIGDEAFPTITVVGMVQGNDLYGSRVLGELQKIKMLIYELVDEKRKPNLPKVEEVPYPTEEISPDNIPF